MTAGVASASPLVESAASPSPGLHPLCSLDLIAADSVFSIADLTSVAPAATLRSHLEKLRDSDSAKVSPQSLVRALQSLTQVHLRRTTALDSSSVDALKDVLRSRDVDTAVYVADIGSVVARYFEFIAALPRVVPHYAVKCNPDPVVVRTLALLGANFDCASSEEIRLVTSLGVTDLDARVIYANPCKPVSHIKYAALLGINCMTFDCEDELYKIRDINMHARLLLRIAVDDVASLCPLSSKYGANLKDVPSILITARHLGLAVVGVAFHVGSGCSSVSAYVDALCRARSVFDIALSLNMEPLTMLDIGGGFPGFDGESKITFQQIATTLRDSLDRMFDVSVRVIAEPGRYFVSRAFTLATQVVTRRKVSPYQSAVVIGDGVYGSFKDAILLNLEYSPHGVIRRQCDSCYHLTCDKSNNLQPTTLYGPTCDVRDIVARDILLPSLDDGDWLYFPNMGAYTTSLATNYNGYNRPAIFYHLSLPV